MVDKGSTNSMTVDQLRQMYRRIAQAGISVENPVIKTGISEGKSEEQKKEVSLRISELSQKIQFDDSYRQFLNSLCEIEEFVLEVLGSDVPALQLIENEFGMKVLEMNRPLGSYFSKIRRFSNACKHGYIFSEHVQLFLDCWIKLELGMERFNNPRSDSSKYRKLQYEVFNDLLRKIRDVANSPSFKKRMGRRKEKTTKRYHSAKSHIDRLFDNHPKMLVVRINLSYRHEVAMDRTDRDVKSDLQNLKNNGRKNSALLKETAGDIWALKWAPGTGLYIHLIIFFVSSGKFTGDELAVNVGKYWVEHITNNFGQYTNCNSSTINDWKLGIGEISADDNEKRARLLDVVLHLAESEEYLRATRLGSGKLFG